MTLEEIKKELQAIIDKLDSDEDLSDDDVKELEEKAAKLETEKRALIDKAEKRQEVLKKVASGSGDEVEKVLEKKGEENMNKEYRSAWLKKIRGLQLNEAEERAYATSGVGGVIPVEIGEEIIKKIKDNAPLLGEVTLLHVNGSVKFAVEGTKTAAAKHTENASITADSDTLTTVTLNGYEVTKLIQVSDAVKTMSDDVFETWLVDMIAEMIADKLTTLIISGTGSGEATGIESANTWGASNSVTVAKTGSLTAANVQTLMSLLKAGYSKNAKFLMSNATLFGDFMPLQNLAQSSIVTEKNGTFYIYGKEVLISEEVAAHEAFFGNFKKYVANLAEDVAVVSGFDIDSNSNKYLGKAVFDGKVALGEAFVKLIKATS